MDFIYIRCELNPNELNVVNKSEQFHKELIESLNPLK